MYSAKIGMVQIKSSLKSKDYIRGENRETTLCLGVKPHGCVHLGIQSKKEMLASKIQGSLSYL